jgi:hypothetical protein
MKKALKIYKKLKSETREILIHEDDYRGFLQVQDLNQNLFLNLLEEAKKDKYRTKKIYESNKISKEEYRVKIERINIVVRSITNEYIK